MLTDAQLVPYLMELEHVVAAALSHFERLQVAATTWVAIREGPPSPVATSRGAEAQRTAFDALEAFLASWARASLLVYPTSREDFSRGRGEILREKLQLPDNTLDDRALRDSWVHCDERIDTMVSRGHFANLQRFLLSGEVTDAIIRVTPRVVVMDTLRVFYHHRDGEAASADLSALNAALRSLQEAVEGIYPHFFGPAPSQV